MQKKRSFYEIGKIAGTDKVTDHKYHYAYDRFLSPLRSQKVKLLEIGLGCDMVTILIFHLY